MPESISRRRFLIGSAPLALLGPGALLAESAWSRPRRKRYYVLSPEWDHTGRCNLLERRKPRSCHGCKACHAHGKNKMFASRRAADRRRAHAGCKCRVILGGTLDADTWAELFGGPRRPKRLEVDKRSRRTQEILRRARRRAQLRAKRRRAKRRAKKRRA